MEIDGTSGHEGFVFRTLFRRELPRRGFASRVFDVCLQVGIGLKIQQSLRGSPSQTAPHGIEQAIQDQRRMLLRRGGDEHVMTFSKVIAARVAKAGPTGSPGGGELDDNRLKINDQYFRQATHHRPGFRPKWLQPRRCDEDIIQQGELIANGFDEMVIYEDQCTRGRADGEVIRLTRQGLERGQRLLPENIHETRGEMLAIEMTLRKMRQGDLVRIQADQVEEVIQFVQQLLPKLVAEHLVPTR